MASYVDGKTAALVPVTLQSKTEGESLSLVILTQSSEPRELAVWNATHLRIEDSQSFQDPSLHISPCYGNGEAVTAMQSEVPPPVLAAIRKNKGAFFWSHPRRHQLPILLVSLIVVVGGLYFTLPALSRMIAQKVPIRWEQQVGGQFLPYLKNKQAHESEVAETAIQSLVNSLRPKAGELGSELEFHVQIQTDSIVNAFAFPGGIIVVNCGLINQAENADELAGVLAHEMQHVILRHVLAGLIRATLLTGVWTAAVGDYSGLVALDPHTIYQIASLKFNRNDEAAADRGALASLKRAKISPVGMVKFFERVERQENKLTSLISSHPASNERAQMFSQEQTENTPFYPALKSEEWLAIRKVCSAS